MFPPDVPTKSSYSKKSFDPPTREDPYRLPPSYVGSEQGTRGSGRRAHGVSLLGVLGALTLLGLLTGPSSNHPSSVKVPRVTITEKRAASTPTSPGPAFWFFMGATTAAVVVLLAVLFAAMSSNSRGARPPRAVPGRMDRPARVERPLHGSRGNPKARPRCAFV